jgi:non-specific serine/threonine protein kinase
MLETIRAFGLEMLAAGGEAVEAAERHFSYFHTLVNTDITRGQQTFHPGRVATDIDNVRAALRWAISERSAVNALTLAAALREFWSVRGLTSEGRRWLDAALALDGDAPVAVRTAALDAACSHACHQGDLDRAEEYAALSLAMNRDADEPAGLVESLHYAGLVAHLRGDYQRARVLYEECVALRRGLGNPAVTRTLGNLAQIMFHLGDSDSAVQMFADCITMDTINHNLVGQSLLMTDLALILLVTGDNERAHDLFRAALPIHCELGHIRMITYSIQGLATLAARGELPERAIRLFGAADAFREAIVHPIQDPDQWRYQESVELARSQLDPATFTAIWDAGREMSIDAAVAYALGVDGG